MSRGDCPVGHLLRDKGLTGMWAAVSYELWVELRKKEAISTARLSGSPRGKQPPLPLTLLLWHPDPHVPGSWWWRAHEPRTEPLEPEFRGNHNYFTVCFRYLSPWQKSDQQNFILCVLWFCLYVYAPCACLVPTQRSEGDVRSPGTGVRDDCEPHHVVSGNGTWVTWKSSQCVNCWATSPVPVFVFWGRFSIWYSG